MNEKRVFQNDLKKRRIRQIYGRKMIFENDVKKRRIRRYILFSYIWAKNDF